MKILDINKDTKPPRSKRLIPEATPAAPAKPAKKAASAIDPAPETGDDGMVKLRSVPLTNRLNNLEHVLDNMMVAHGTGTMLGGATGIGKTTFVKQLARLLGMELIVIEAPHITEEEVINIPFITFLPMQEHGKQMIDSVSAKKFNVQLAKSHLASELAKAKPISDQQYMANMAKMDANTRAMFQALGGGDGKIPPEIEQIRRKYKVILFIDEYMRQTGQNVRNILRGILNGRIGNDRMPAGVYVTYASNLSDVGQTVEPVPMNQDFKLVDFKPPSKDEFFHYLISRFEKDQDVKLKPEVINAFHKALDDSHISYDDLDNEIRTSPRRWEQIILYVNASVPVEDEKSAAALMANVKANFSSETNVSNLHKFVDDIVRRIIRDTGGGSLANTRPLESGDWRGMLQHQIATKIKLGDSRSYIPVVMGAPGIGKTAAMSQIAHNLNLRLISIDCSTLSSDDITGIPIPGEGGKELSTDFAEPALYQRIMQDMRDADEEFMADPKVSEEQKARYGKQRFKYLIFFDELNRVNNSKIFNSLRRVILEKSFNDKVKLPNNSIVTAAMNPGDRGTSELTGHLKDAIDLIDAQPSWKAFTSWLDSEIKSGSTLEPYDDAAKTMAKKILMGFAETFGIKLAIKKDDRPSKMSTDELPFHIKLQDADDIYISPREYFTMYADIVSGISRAMRSNRLSEDDLYKAVIQKLEHTLKWIMKKHEVDSPQLLLAVASWLKQTIPQFMVKKRTAVGLEGMLDATMEDNGKHLKDDPDFINYARSFDTNRFNEEMSKYFNKIITREKSFYDSLLTKKHTKKSIEKGTVKLLDDMVDDITYIVNEVKMAVEANDLSNEIVDGLESSLIKSIEDNLGDEDISEDVFNDILERIHGIFT